MALSDNPLSTRPLSTEKSASTTSIKSVSISGTSTVVGVLSKSPGIVRSVTSTSSPLVQSTATVLTTNGFNNTGIGTVAITSPGNITATDGSLASVNANASTISNYLVANTFNFAIPTNAIILGCIVTIKISGSSSSATGGSYNMVMWNGTSTTLDQSISSPQTYSNAATVTFGSSTNTITALTPSIVNSTGFGAAFFNIAGSGGAQLIQIDSVSIQLFYITVFTGFFKSAAKSLLGTSIGVGTPPIPVAQVLTPSYFTSTVKVQSSGTFSTWANPQNTLANDSTYATLTDTANGSHDLIYSLSDLTSIPSNATITGIQVQVYASTSTLSEGLFVEFANNSTTPTYYGNSISNGFASTGSLQTVTFGSSTSTFGLLPAQLAGSWWNGSASSLNFWTSGVAGATLSMDYITIQVWYNVPVSTFNVLKTVNVSKSSASSGIASIIKNASKTISDISSGIANVIASIVSTGTTYYQTIAGTSVGIVALAKNSAKIFSTSSSSVPLLIKNITKSFIGIGNNSTSIQKGVNVSRGITSTIVPKVQKNIAVIKTAQEISISTILKTINKTEGVSSVGSVLLNKNINKNFSITSTSVPAFLKNSTKTILSSSVGSSSVLKTVNKIENGTSIGSTSVQKGVSVSKSTTSSGIGSFIKNITKVPFIVSSVGIGIVVKNIAKSFIATSIGIASKIAGAAKFITLSVVSTGIISLNKNINVIKTVSSTAVYSLQKSINKPLNITSVGIVSLIKNITKSPFIVSSIGIASKIAGAAKFITLSVISIGVPSIIKNSAKVFNTSSIGIVSLKKGINVQRLVQSIGIVSTLKSITKSISGTSIANGSMIKTITKVPFVVSSIGVVSLRKVINLFRSVQSTEIVNIIKIIGIVKAVQGIGNVSIVKGITKSFTVISSAIGTLISNFLQPFQQFMWASAAYVWNGVKELGNRSIQIGKSQVYTGVQIQKPVITIQQAEGLDVIYLEQSSDTIVLQQNPEVVKIQE